MSRTDQLSNPARAEALPSELLSENRPAIMSHRQRFLDACACRRVDRSPVWLMRQAGRALPEYRALKEKHTFLELIQNPELAAEVTLQPIRRFDFDAAILFSDILVIAEGLGQPYAFSERGGIQMEFLLNSATDVERLEPDAVINRLQYVATTLSLLRSALGGRQALLGFAGSPWTLANFMIEGGGVKEYFKAKQLFYSDNGLFCRLMEKLAYAVTEFLRLQIQSGVDAVQIFDSLGGLLAEGSFAAASGRWIKQIIQELKAPVPVIVFSKGTHGNWPDLVNTGAQVLGVDSNVRLARIGQELPSNVGLQGNLDPFLLTTNPATVAVETRRLLLDMQGRPGHIFNLGHGVPPNAKLENITALVDTVRGFGQ